MSDAEQLKAWEQVMAGLTGRRLAIYDALLLGYLVSTEVQGVASAQALSWLMEHHFVRMVGDTLAARTVLQARELYTGIGPRETAKPVPVPPVEKPIQPEAPRPVVQRHQAEMFAMEGYKL
jgi:hypothetical protein